MASLTDLMKSQFRSRLHDAARSGSTGMNVAARGPRIVDQNAQGIVNKANAMMGRSLMRRGEGIEKAVVPTRTPSDASATELLEKGGGNADAAWVGERVSTLATLNHIIATTKTLPAHLIKGLEMLRDEVQKDLQ
jgi:hypothetical protein